MYVRASNGLQYIINPEEMQNVVIPISYVSRTGQLENEDGEVEDFFPEDTIQDEYSDLVEAIVVIANDGTLLKAEANPYMMKDRPILAYQDDTVPNRLLGRGTVEKAYNSQKAIDAQVRSHLDSLALTTSPMMAMDATRLITCLYLTLGKIVIPPFSKVGALNKAAAMYLPANSPA